MVRINILLSDISVYDVYLCLSFITYTDINFENIVFDRYVTFLILKSSSFC